VPLAAPWRRLTYFREVMYFREGVSDCSVANAATCLSPVLAAGAEADGDDCGGGEGLTEVPTYLYLAKGSTCSTGLRVDPGESGACKGRGSISGDARGGCCGPRETLGS